ncbi:flavodoxin [Spirochaetia bacterium]|nr:flavodoxin [Spirochaetia bacterium]
MEKKLIVGISSSPRKGANTDILLAHALTAAESYEYIKTEMIYLRDYEIAPCNSCVACCTEAAAKGSADKACLSFRDGMDAIYPKLLECSGLILASPVYFGSVNAQMKAFMDRTEGLLRYGFSKYKNALSNKVGGAVTVGGNRNAGQEFTLQTIHYYFSIQDMIIVGSGNEPIPGCYLGGGATTWPERGRIRDAVLQDEIGLKSTANLGRKVAAVIGMFK